MVKVDEVTLLEGASFGNVEVVELRVCSVVGSTVHEHWVIGSGVWYTMGLMCVSYSSDVVGGQLKRLY